MACFDVCAGGGRRGRHPASAEENASRSSTRSNRSRRSNRAKPGSKKSGSSSSSNGVGAVKDSYAGPRSGRGVAFVSLVRVNRTDFVKRGAKDPKFVLVPKGATLQLDTAGPERVSIRNGGKLGEGKEMEDFGRLWSTKGLKVGTEVRMKVRYRGARMALPVKVVAPQVKLVAPSMPEPSDSDSDSDSELATVRTSVTLEPGEGLRLVMDENGYGQDWVLNKKKTCESLRQTDGRRRIETRRELQGASGTGATDIAAYLAGRFKPGRSYELWAKDTYRGRGVGHWRIDVRVSAPDDSSSSSSSNAASGASYSDDSVS